MKLATIVPATILMSFMATFPTYQAAKAQVTIDVEAITCSQFVRFNVADPNQIGLWLSGYFHGKHGDKKLHVQDFRKNLEDLKKACQQRDNYEIPVLQVIEELFKK
jgi:hypothetical protein